MNDVFGVFCSYRCCVWILLELFVLALVLSSAWKKLYPLYKKVEPVIDSAKS